MRRPSLAVVIVASIAVTLTACATGAGTPAESSQIAESARSLGIAPDLVYTTDVDGYDLAPQSVGTSGSEGLRATWFNEATAAMVTIRTDRGEVTADSCPAIPLENDFDAAVTCEEDADGLWHRWAGDTHEYVAPRDGVLVRVIGTGAPSEDLRAAALAVRVPSAPELEALFSDAPESPAGPPVERGDLPEHGDGAPIDPTGAGG